MLFIHPTLLLDKIFDSQIDLGYYKGVVPFPSPPAAGAGQGVPLTVPQACSTHEKVLITVSLSN